MRRQRRAGGSNTRRASSGAIRTGAKAQVVANFTGGPGTDGMNLLASCTGVSNLGTVSPAFPIPGDDAGVCVPVARGPIVPLCTGEDSPSISIVLPRGGVSGT